jgi:hypothetical protein
MTTYTTTDDRTAARRFDDFDEAQAAKNSLKDSDRLLARLVPIDGKDPRNGLAIGICRDLSTGREVYVAPEPTVRELEAAIRFEKESRDPNSGRHAQRFFGTSIVRVVFNGDTWHPATDKTWVIVEETKDDFVAYEVIDGDRTGFFIVVAGPKFKRTDLRKSDTFGRAPYAPLSRPGESF